MTVDDSIQELLRKKRALKLLENGLLTMPEVAALTGISRQGVAKWCKVAGINAVAARARYVRALWKSTKS